MIKTFACAIVISALTFSAASAAGSGEQVQSEIVRFGDLNLASPAGVKTLHQRLNAAAYRVCDEKLALKSDVFARRRERTCQILAVQRAQATVTAARGTVFLTAAR